MKSFEDLTSPPREPELAGKCTTDDEGKPLNGEYALGYYDPESPVYYTRTIYNYKDGKIHGSPAIIYPDGQEEDWDKGEFVKISLIPFDEREFE